MKKRRGSGALKLNEAAPGPASATSCVIIAALLALAGLWIPYYSRPAHHRRKPALHNHLRLFRSSSSRMRSWTCSVGGHRAAAYFMRCSVLARWPPLVSVRVPFLKIVVALMFLTTLWLLYASLRHPPFLSILPFIGGGNDGPHGHRFSSVVAEKTRTRCKLTGRLPRLTHAVNL